MSPGKRASMMPPAIQKEPDWEEVELPFNIGSGRSLYSGLEHDGRLRLRVYRQGSTGRLVGRVWFGQGADGPPGHAHGGAIAYVLDEAMGSVAWMNDYPALAAKLEFQYVRMTPLETDLKVEAWIEQTTKKRLIITANLVLPSGEICVAGRGEFAILQKSRVGQLASAMNDPKGLFQNPKLKWASEDAG